MLYTVLLDSSANTVVSEQEEKAKFVRFVLESLNVDISFWDPNQLILDVPGRQELRKVLQRYEVQMIDSGDGTAEMVFDGKVIARWYRPQYCLKTDPSQRDRNKKLFLEMNCEFDSIFEEEVGAQQG